MCVIRGTYIDVNHVRCTGTIQSTHGFRVRAETRTSYLYDPRTYGYVLVKNVTEPSKNYRIV